MDWLWRVELARQWGGGGKCSSRRFRSVDEEETGSGRWCWKRLVPSLKTSFYFFEGRGATRKRNPSITSGSFCVSETSEKSAVHKRLSFGGAGLPRRPSCIKTRFLTQHDGTGNEGVGAGEGDERQEGFWLQIMTKEINIGERPKSFTNTRKQDLKKIFIYLKVQYKKKRKKGWD